MAKDWARLGQDVMGLVGGEANVTAVTHCFTRLRLTLKDESVVDDASIEALDGVMKVVHAPGQVQVVIGTSVSDVYEEVAKAYPHLAAGEVEATAEEAAEDAAGKGEKASLSLNSLIDVVTNIFGPLVGAFCAAGLLKAFVVMSSTFGWMDPASSTYVILNCVGDGLFQFLPILLGYSAGKHFGCNPWISAAVAAFLVHPSMVSIMDTFAEAGGPNLFGIPVVMPAGGYLQSVFPIILAAYAQSWIEKPVKLLPKTLRSLVGNMIVLLATSILTLFVVGPVVNTVSTAVANGLNFVLTTIPLLGGFLIGAVWPVLIMFGMHFAIFPLVFANIAALGYDIIMPISINVNYTIGAICLAVIIKSKLPKVRSLAIECLGSSWVGGISEPAIYGLLLKYKRLFAIMCLASGVAGAFVAVSNVQQVSVFTSSIFTIPAVLGVLGPAAVISIGIGMVIGFGLTIAVGFKDSMVSEEDK